MDLLIADRFEKITEVNGTALPPENLLSISFMSRVVHSVLAETLKTMRLKNAHILRGSLARCFHHMVIMPQLNIRV